MIKEDKGGNKSKFSRGADQFIAGAFPYFFGGKIGGGYDSDASAYFDTAGISEDVETAAANQFILNLKTGPLNGNNLWVDVFTGGAVYGLSPTSLAAAAYNLRDPAAFPITWMNGPTHAITGVTGNGTTQYGKTGYIVSTEATIYDTTLSVYRRNDTSNKMLIGGESASTTFDLWKSGATDIRSRQYAGGITGTSDAVGLVTGTVRSNIDAELYINATSIGTDNTVGGGLTADEVYIMTRNYEGSPNLLSTDEFALFGIGKGMNLSQVQDWNSAVQTYQTNVITGGRQV